MTFIMIPIFEITIQGTTVPVADRLISLEITDKKGIQSDQLTLTIADPDNAITLPRRGVELTAKIGYENTGLVDKGTYIVDQTEYSSPPNTLTITASAVNFRGAFREVRQQSYHNTTVGGILRIIAGRNALEVVITETLDQVEIPHIDQTVSDAMFFKQLGDRFDAIATIKSGRLIFAKNGTGKTATGVNIPSIAIDQSDCANWRLAVTDREHEATGIKARYLNRAQSIEEVILIGDAENTITLPKPYPTKAEAEQAAYADLQRRKRTGQQLSLNLAVGNPNIIAEQPAILSGFKQEIDGSGWIIEDVTHSLNSGGLSSSVNLKSKGR